MQAPIQILTPTATCPPLAGTRSSPGRRPHASHRRSTRYCRNIACGQDPVTCPGTSSHRALTPILSRRPCRSSRPPIRPHVPCNPGTLSSRADKTPSASSCARSSRVPRPQRRHGCLLPGPRREFWGNIELLFSRRVRKEGTWVHVDDGSTARARPVEL